MKNKKAKIYQPAKSVMQSGINKTKKWVLEYDTLKTGINALMGWETSNDTMSEVKLEFPDKKSAIRYANKNKIEYYLVEPKKRKILIKSYVNNFLKDH